MTYGKGFSFPGWIFTVGGNLFLWVPAPVFSLAPDSSKDCFLWSPFIWSYFSAFDGYRTLFFQRLSLTLQRTVVKNFSFRFSGAQESARASKWEALLPLPSYFRHLLHLWESAETVSLLIHTVQQVRTRALCHPRVSSASIFLRLMIQDYGKELLNGSNLGWLLGFRAPYCLVHLSLTLKHLLIC